MRKRERVLSENGRAYGHNHFSIVESIFKKRLLPPTCPGTSIQIKSLIHSNQKVKCQVAFSIFQRHPCCVGGGIFVFISF